MVRHDGGRGKRLGGWVCELKPIYLGDDTQKKHTYARITNKTIKKQNTQHFFSFHFTQSHKIEMLCILTTKDILRPVVQTSRLQSSKRWKKLCLCKMGLIINSDNHIKNKKNETLFFYCLTALT